MKKTIWSFFIDNYRLTYVITIGIVIFGLLAMFQIPKESSPEIEIPIFVVSTQLPGASAEDVEELVTDVIEDRLQGLSDIDTITSASQQGFSQIVVSFNVESDAQEKSIDVKDRIDGIGSSLPEDASDPLVQQISFTDVPIATLAVSGPYDREDLKVFAEEIQSEIERIQDVSQVNIIGAPEEEIRVTLLPERLAQYSLSSSQVVAAISQSNVDIPIGSIETGNDVFTLRFAGRLENAEDVRNVSIESRNGIPVLLGDIAEVSDDYSQTNSITRLGAYNTHPETAIFIDVYKQSGQGDIISIADEVKGIIEEKSQGSFPADVAITLTRDDAELIETDLNNLLINGIETMVIVVVVLVIFLGWREAFLTSLIVPMTYLITFIVINYFGYTINFLTLFSLILALGILVDASIVVVESSFEKMSKGADGKTAALETLYEFQMPLISGTLTTIFVFLPMLLMTGIIGKFIESIPVTVSVALTASIIVALGFITTFVTRFLHVKKGDTEGGIKKVKEWIVVAYSWYEKTLSKMLNSRKNSKRFLYIAAVAFVVAMLMPVLGVVKVVMFPQEDFGTLTINLENPVGTPLAITNAMAEEIEAELSKDPRIKNYVTRIGAGAGMGSIATGGVSSHQGSFAINLIDERDETSQEITVELEQKLAPLVSGKISAGQQESGPAQGAPVQIRLVGESLEDLETAARTLAASIEKIPGTRNIENGIKESNGELVFEIDRAKARAFGVTELQIAQALRTAVSGSLGTTINAGGEDINVIVTSKLGQNASIGTIDQVSVNDLNSISVLTARGQMPISSFGKVLLGSSRSSIAHEDGDRVITVTAETVPGANAQVITRTVLDSIPSLNFPDSVSVAFGGEAEDIQESFASLGRAMILGIILIVALLIWQFKSIRQPIFIVVTIPLALIGVFTGLAITGQPLTFPGFIGIVALAGIVVNNAIILIDSINMDRKDGLNKIDAISKSAKSRLQPIILTTLTTVSGMLPLAISNPTWAPLAISIVAGLMFSTILTLFVIPILYLLFAEEELVF